MNKMKNILKIGGLVFGLALILLAVAGSANASVVIPSKSVINPVTQTVYVPNNGASPSEVRIYYRSGNSWLETRKISITTSTTAKVYGLAISADGKKLFVSINDSYQSQLRVYDLDLNNYGIPTTYNYQLAQWTPASYDSPAGVTVVDNRAYVADMGSARVHIFDYDGSNWKKTGEITEGLTGLGAIYDVTTGPKVNNKFGYSYPIFVSRKTNVDAQTKQLFMYSCNYAVNPQTYVVTTSITFLSSVNASVPTYMKVANGKLYVAVKDSTADVKIFDYTSGALVEDATPINNGTNLNYGWAGLDLAPDSGALYYTQAQSSSENPTKLIKVVLPGTNPIIQASHTSPSDGLVITPDNMYAISTYSWSGTIQADQINDKPIKPVITSISPTQCVYGVTTEAIVTGKYFTGTTIINFGGAPAGDMPTSILSPTTVKVTVDGSFFNKIKGMSNKIQVFELGGRNGSDTTQIVTFPNVTFTVNPSTANWPTVTSIDPNNGVQGQTVTIINLIGTNFIKGATPADSTSVNLFQAGTNITINATNVTVVDDKHITCALPLSNPIPPTGPYDVIVTNPDSNFGTLPAGFTVFAPGTAPTVIKIEPNVGLIESSISGKITGTNFQAGATAYLSKAGQPPILINLSNITPTSMDYSIVNSGDIIGLWTVNVKNPNNQTGSLYNGFNIIVDAAKVPTVTAVYPSKAPNTVDTNIIIEGTNLDTANAADIQINPTKPLTNLKVISATKLSATFPAKTYGLQAGTYHITVANQFGTSAQTPADTFEVISGNENPPVASQIKNFNAADNQDKQSTLTWTNPADNDMAEIKVMRTGPLPKPVDITKYPISNTDGTQVYPVSGQSIIPKPGEAINFVDNNNNLLLTNDQVYYYVAFIKDTSGNWSAVDYTMPDVNADTAIPGATTDPVVNLQITREGDAPKSNINITWDTNPPGLGIDIYSLTCTADATTGNYSSYFTTEATSGWTKVADNVTLGKYAIPSSVGTGTAQYFKLIQHGTTLTNNDLLTNVVGKFDLAVGPSDQYPELAIISIPLELNDYSVSAVFGNQASEADSIVIIDNNYAITQGMNFESNAWVPISGKTPLNTLSQGQGYVYSTLSQKFMTLVGKVREAKGNKAIKTGLDAQSQFIIDWLGNSFPSPVNVGQAGLNNTSAGADALTAATVSQLDGNGAIIGGLAGYAEHRTTTTWVDSNNSPATLQLMPGKGYLITDPLITSSSWDQPRP